LLLSAVLLPVLSGARRCRSIFPARLACSSKPAAAAAQNGTTDERTDEHRIVT